MNKSNAHEYDVAVSFLHRDEPLALELFNRLSETFNVFVYSKRQEQLAARDGLTEFRHVFKEKSRLVVVLFRKGWGETPWTRVEQQSIEDRFLKEGWEWLLFVVLDSTHDLPPWLPETRIRLYYEEYGFEQLLGAIRARAQQLGAVSRTEATAERAARVAREAHERSVREKLLNTEGIGAVQEETLNVFRILVDKAIALSHEVPELGIEAEADKSECVLNTLKAGINLYPYYTHPVTESRLVMRKWPNRVILPRDRDRKAYLLEPKDVGEQSFYFDYRPEYGGWCWEERSQPAEYRKSDELAEYCLRVLLDVHDRVERGVIKPRGFADL